MCTPDALDLVAAWGGCPKNNWAERAAETFGQRESKSTEPTVLINVGANKGYNAASFLSLWSTARNMTIKKWSNAITNYARGVSNGTSWKHGYLAFNQCGACGSCRAREPKAHGRNSGKVHMLELLQSNRQLLRHLCAETNVCDLAQVHDFAASNVTRVEQAPGLSAKAGVEYKSLAWPNISQRSLRKFDSTVQAITIDEFMQRQQLRRVFTVDIDTEGWDALVLEGMHATLSEHRVTFVEFEYSGRGYWSNSTPSDERRTLERTLAWMFKLGYVCFMESGKYLAQISWPCWRPQYERQRWSNVLCAQDPQALSLLHGMAKRGYEERTQRQSNKRLRPRHEKSKSRRRHGSKEDSVSKAPKRSTQVSPIKECPPYVRVVRGSCFFSIG